MLSARAVTLAQDYAIAHATLAMGLGLVYEDSAFQDITVINEALNRADRALELNPGSIMSPTMRVSYTPHFTDAWNATPVEPGA